MSTTYAYISLEKFFQENPIDFGDYGRRSVGHKTIKRESNKLDLTDRLKRFTEFQGVAEHQQFMSSIVKERELKARLKELLRFVTERQVHFDGL